jgi:hypothetical protein
MEMYFDRVLNLKELEAWDIVIENKTYRMILIDEKRQSTRKDFSEEINVLDDDEMRANIIKVEVYSEEKVLDNHILQLDQLSKSFTNHLALAHCHVRVTFSIADIDEALARHVKRKYSSNLEEIPLEKYFYLNQDL